MKKTILSIGLSLIFGLALASNSLKEQSKTYQFEVSPDGICIVFIYENGELMKTEVSFQPDAEACEAWAAGRLWEYLKAQNPGTGVD